MTEMPEGTRIACENKLVNAMEEQQIDAAMAEAALEMELEEDDEMAREFVDLIEKMAKRLLLRGAVESTIQGRIENAFQFATLHAYFGPETG